MLGEFFQKMKVLRREVGAQSVNDHRIVDGVPDVVAVAGVCRRGADLQRDFDGLGDGLLARVIPINVGMRSSSMKMMSIFALCRSV